MADTTFSAEETTLVNAATAPEGAMGQVLLVAGERVALRLWEEEPGDDKPRQSRSYETVGFVLDGRATLHLGDDTVALEPGDSWVVPPGIEHTYTIDEFFRAIEATAPPARDEA